MTDAEFYRAVQSLREAQEVLLVTIVDTRGSTPREAGAKMAVCKGGSAVGTIGGGEVEALVQKCAMEMPPEVSGRTATVSLANEVGSGKDICGGTLEVLIERLPKLGGSRIP